MIYIFLMSALSFASPHLFSTKNHPERSLSTSQRALYEATAGELTLTSDTVSFTLPHDVKVTSRRSNERIEDSRHHWSGSIDGDPHGFANLILDAGSLSGEIVAGGHHYWLRSTQGHFWIVEDFTTDIEGPDPVLPKAPSELTPLAAVTTPSSDNFIDVMIVYTQDVAAETGAENVLRARVDAANTMLERSCANFRFRLVHIAQVTYTETANYNTDLSQLAGEADGQMDGIHALRDAHGADLVQLVTIQGSSCGLGYLGQHNFFNEDYGFSVSGYWCNARTMAHEWAHNMSISHDRYEQEVGLQESTLLLSGYGYVDLLNRYYDIMAYSNHCNDLGLNCTSMGVFSNPRISHNGVPFGLAGYSDAVTRMNDAYPYVANFRNAITPFSADVQNRCISASEDKDMHCFIATAAFGSPLNSQVKKFRYFRDHVLMKYPAGRLAVDVYYEVSPPIARWVQKSTLLKIWVQGLLWSLLLAAEYGMYLLALLIIVFLNRRSQRPWAPWSCVMLIGLLSTNETQAQVAAPSKFIYQHGTNPSLRLIQPAEPFIGASYKKRDHVRKNGSAYREEESHSSLQFMLGYLTREYFIEGAYAPENKYDTTIKQTGFSDLSTEHKVSSYLVQAGLSVWGLPIGVRYASNLDETSTPAGEHKITTLNVGSTARWGDFLRLGGGLQIFEESGDAIASTKWAQTYVGLALGNFASEMGMISDSQYFIEVSLQRAPEVLAIDGALTTAHGEKLITQVNVEANWSNLAWISSFSLRAEYEQSREKAMSSYVLEDHDTTTWALHAGTQVFSGGYSSAEDIRISVFYQNRSTNSSFDESTKTVGLALTYAGAPSMGYYSY